MRQACNLGQQQANKAVDKHPMTAMHKQWTTAQAEETSWQHLIFHLMKTQPSGLLLQIVIKSVLKAS
jgi:hypothetical protein